MSLLRMKSAYTALIACTAIVASAPTFAADNMWLGPDNGGVSLDYNVPANWDVFGVNAVPDAGNGVTPYDDVALINNGDAVFLNSNTGDAEPSGLTLAGGSSLDIQAGGVLHVDPAQGTEGLLPGNIDQSSNSTLSVQSDGTLTAVGTANLNGTTQLVGPTATFSAGGFALGSSHTLQAMITSATHSPLTSLGAASLAGDLVLDITGVTPTAGNSWVLVDAASVSGGFSNVSVTGDLPLGQRFAVGTAAGGNGQQVVATVDNQLVLYVTTATGEVSIKNYSAASPITIDGYSITAATPVLNVAGWTSFQEDGQATWEEANPAANHLSETTLTGSRTLNGGATVGLGTAYPAATQFGQSALAPVEFAYHINGGETVTGAVVYSANTFVLQVDPTSGQAQIVNPSGFDVAIDGYSIVSEDGSLLTGTWDSFEQDGQAGWEEANPSSKHLSEINLTGTRLFEKLEQTAPVSLGQIFGGGTRDLEFTFHVVSDALVGDYNEDGEVNLADYTVWRDNLGAPAGTLPNDSENVAIGAAQYQTWKDNFGSTGGGGSSQTYIGVVEYVSLSPIVAGGVAVPEPTSWLLACTGLALLGFKRRSVLSK